MTTVSYAYEVAHLGTSSLDDAQEPKGGGWLSPKDRCRLRVGESPYFIFSLPLSLHKWLLRPMPGDDPSMSPRRIEWILEEAFDRYHKNARMYVPQHYFAPGVVWSNVLQIHIDSNLLTHLRMWGQRVQIDPRTLLVSLIDRAYQENKGRGLTPPNTAFELESQV